MTVKVYVREARRYRVALAGSFIGMFLYSLGEDILIPYFMASLVDTIVAGADFHKAYQAVWLIAGAAMCNFLLARMTFFFRNPVLSKTTQQLSMRIFEAYERQEYSFYANAFVGSLVARATRFLKTFNEAYDQVLFPGTALVVQTVIPIFILGSRAWILGLIFISAALIMAFVSVILSRRRTATLRNAATADSNVTAALADLLTNNQAVKLFAQSSYERKRFKDVTDIRRRKLDLQTKAGEQLRAIRSLTVIGFQLSVAFALVYLAERRRISLGTILLAQVYLTKLGASLWNMHRIVERLEESLADSAEMTEILNRQPVVQDPAEPQQFTSQRGEIVIQNMDFVYDDNGPDGEALFRGLNVDIQPGEKVGLVGPSGGGKSTLTKLLLRLMDVRGGAILIDGLDIRQVTQDSLRAHIAYVPQEPVLFHRTIKENILYGDPSASEADVISAAKLAHAHEFITLLPNGYDTLVGERGVKLSGGEKQRIAIARAMLKKSPILILDEATSALDSKSEKAIVAALDNLMKNRTTIVIAHRLSTIRKLDRVLVLKDGRIVEDGPHDQLLAQRNGVYAELWQHQTDAFIAE